jgi:hypothetical protein
MFTASSERTAHERQKIAGYIGWQRAGLRQAH